MKWVRLKNIRTKLRVEISREVIFALNHVKRHYSSKTTSYCRTSHGSGRASFHL